MAELLWLKDVPASGAPGAPETAPASEVVDREAPKRPLRCARCGNRVTHESLRAVVDGSHEHTRLNPLAYAFHFGCFADAQGAEIAGPPSTEHSWFTGCAWQYAYCRSCGVHLGWFFSGAQAFFGLLVERLVPEPESPQA